MRAPDNVPPRQCAFRTMCRSSPLICTTESLTWCAAGLGQLFTPDLYSETPDLVWRRSRPALHPWSVQRNAWLGMQEVSASSSPLINGTPDLVCRRSRHGGSKKRIVLPRSVWHVNASRECNGHLIFALQIIHNSHLGFHNNLKGYTHNVRLPA